MFSILLLGFGLLSTRTSAHKISKKEVFSIFIICLGISFRPWLSVALIPLVMILVLKSRIKKSKIFVISIVVALSAIPISFEIATTNLLNLNESYPQQQVMMMDIAATYCYTNNQFTGVKAKAGLEIFTVEPDYSSIACQLYRPDTWLSLTNGGNESSKGLKTNFWLIEPGEREKYSQLQSTWTNLIFSDPISYLQNKVLFSGKLLLGSDSREITFLTEEKTLNKIASVYRIPFDLAISLHLFSMLSTIIFLLINPVKRFVKKKTSYVQIGDVTVAIFLSSALWIVLSSIAYIGSNGRYTYSLTLLAFIIHLRYFKAPAMVGD
jgi:hypothetical protein